MRKVITPIALTFIVITAFAQTDDTGKPEITRIYIALGAGLDFGGFGLNLMAMPSEHFGVFAGGGYNLVGFGFNGGARIFFNKQTKPFRPYIMAMYGYNAAFHIKNAEQYNKIFYGPTFGFGIDLGSRRGNDRFWTFALNFPIRDPKIDEYISDLKTQHGVTFTQNLPSVAVSVGYRIGMGKKNGY